MKALVCEMCASNDLVKENGMYVCQSCNTKYTIEEAKKLMVDITGSTVKIDTSDKLANLYSIARRAKENGDSEKAAQYYDSILREDPTSWEATFYTTYFNAMETKIAYIATAANRVETTIKSALELLKENESDKEKQEEAATEIATNTLLIGSMFLSSATKHYNDFNFDDAKARQEHFNEYNSRRLAVIELYLTLGDHLSLHFADMQSVINLCITAWKRAISELNKLNTDSAYEIAFDYQKKIIAFDSSYKKEYYGNRITVLKNLIEKENKREVNGCFGFGLGFGLPFIIVGIITLILSAGIDYVVWIGVICIIIGLIISIACMHKGLYLKKTEEEQDKANNKIKVYEAEIAALEKEMNS